jgi:hypothetical protein
MSLTGAGWAVLFIVVILSSSALETPFGRASDLGPSSFSDVGPSLRGGVGPGWSERTSSSHPLGVAGAMMAYDARADLFVLFGGDNGMPLNQTWVLDPKTGSWTEVHAIRNPPARADAMFIYDSVADAFLLFGGWFADANGSYHRLADTWAFFLGNLTWSQRAPRSNPSPRSDAAVAFDETDGITFVFGGFDGLHYLGDAWYYVFANNTWISRPSSVLPSPRADGRMVYDPGRRSFFLFSGNDYSDPQFNFHHIDDMWRYTWEDNAWVPVSTKLAPTPRDYSVFAPNLAFGELLLVGGFGNRTILGDTWAFNTTELVWRNLTTPIGPSPRMAAVGAYSPVENVLVLFGGGNRNEIRTDTWFFRYPPPLVAIISAASSSVLVGQSVAFRSSVLGGSGGLVNESWNYGDGQMGHGSSTLHSFGGPGIYRIEFVAIDSRGGNVSAAMTVEVGLLVSFWIDVGLLAAGLLAIPIVILFRMRRTRRIAR